MVEFTDFDCCVGIFVILSAIFGCLLGMTRVILNVGSWILGVPICVLFWKYVSIMLSKYITNPDILEYASKSLCYVLSVIILSVIASLITDAVTNSKLCTVDKFFGFVIGSVVGLTLVVCFLAIMTFVNVDLEFIKKSHISSITHKPVYSMLGFAADYGILEKLNFPDQKDTKAQDVDSRLSTENVDCAISTENLSKSSKKMVLNQSER